MSSTSSTSNEIHIPGSHPLSRFATYVSLPLADVEVTSLAMGFYYLLLLHHDRKDLADELISDEVFKWEPNLIYGWVIKKLSTINASFTAQSYRIYKTIVLHQMENPESRYRQAFLDVLNKSSEPSQLRFNIYSAANEMVWSSGRRYQDRHKEKDGFEAWGCLLTEVRDIMLSRNPIDNDRFYELFRNAPSLFQPFCQNSVLIITDSQGRYFDKLAYGTVVPVRGGRYEDATNVFVNGRFEFDSYRWIIVHIGANMGIRGQSQQQQRKEFQRREGEWHELKRNLVVHANRRMQIFGRKTMIFSCTPDHPEVMGNASHAAFIQRQLEGEHIHCVNWRDYHNPFLQPNGRIDPSLYHNDKFHFNHKGLRVVWVTWCDLLGGLKFVTYQLSEIAQGVPKETFRNYGEAGPSKKRKVILG